MIPRTLPTPQVVQDNETYSLLALRQQNKLFLYLNSSLNDNFDELSLAIFTYKLQTVLEKMFVYYEAGLLCD